jgi:hypothetical protein
MTSQPVEQPPVTKESLTTDIQDSAYVLRHFTGRLLDYNITYRPAQGGGSYPHVTFDFDQVVVAPGGSTVPYHLETGQIGVNHNVRSGTVPWAHLMKSVSDLLGPGTNLAQLVGRTMEIDWQKRSVRRPILDDAGNRTSDWADAMAECYVLGSIDGTGSGAASAPASGNSNEDLVAELANGKNAADFQAAAFMSSDFKARPDLFGAVATTGDAVLAQAVQAGKLIKGDDGVYHKIG